MKTSTHQQLFGINYLIFILLSLILIVPAQSFAQSGSKNALLQMINEDRTTIDAIAGYDKNIQSHILKVAETPEILSKIEELQKKSQDQFKDIISGYDQETQGAFYDLARYPNLITDLVRNGNPSGAQVDRIVASYPQDIRETAKQYGPGYYEVLLRIDRLNNEIDGQFRYVLEPYHQQTRESVNVLIGYPEIVSALVNDKEFTALLGEVYREDPNWVMGRLEKVSRELAEQNREDLDAYKNQIQKDPEAYNELLDASEKFSRERNEVRYIDSSEPIIDIRVINSYPYWFGYPYWYSAPYWRPRPLYYHTGFYRNHYGNIEFVGLPSNFFLHWQTFYHPRWYPHLSYNYYNFYENHYMKRYRESPRAFPHNGFYRSIESNVINNPRVNNSRLERIDHQRGNNIVRQPNSMESGSYGRNSRGISRQSGSSNSRQGVGTGNTINRRKYDSVRPGGSEGPYNRNGSATRNGSIRRETTPAPSSQGRTSTGSSQQRASQNNSNFERPQSGRNGTGRVWENGSISNGSSTGNSQSRAVQQRSAAAQRSNNSPVQSERTGRSTAGANRSYSAPQQRGSNPATVQPSGRPAQQQAGKSTSTQPASRKEARVRRSAERSNSAEGSKKEDSSGRK